MIGCNKNLHIRTYRLKMEIKCPWKIIQISNKKTGILLHTEKENRIVDKFTHLFTNNKCRIKINGPSVEIEKEIPIH